MALSLLTAALLTGCAAGDRPDAEIGRASARQPQSLYIVVARNQRLPAEFLTVLKQESQKRLPEANIAVDENAADDQALAAADWIMALRATRIIPNDFFKPSGNSVVNGMVDCLAGSAFGPGVILAPCEYSADSDFLEASLRDASGKTLKTYVAKQDGEGWMWPLPYTAIKAWLSGEDPHQVWIDLINTLYDKMLGDQVFDGDPSATAMPE